MLQQNIYCQFQAFDCFADGKGESIVVYWQPSSSQQVLEKKLAR